MADHLRSVLQIVALSAATVAAMPYVRFLVAPPDAEKWRWVATVVALAVAAAACVALRLTRNADP